jgi:hypothetical protein
MSGSAPAAIWARPQQLARPASADLGAPLAALAGSGQAAVGWDLSEAEPPGPTTAVLALAAAPGGPFTSARTVPGAGSVLAVGSLGSGLELITGSAPPGVDCCTTATASTLDSRGRRGASHTLTDALDGPSAAEFVDLGANRGIALMASAAGVWASSPRGPAVALDGPSSVPRSFAAAPAGRGGWAAVWTDTGGPGRAARLVLASGAAAPSATRRRVLLTAPAGYAIDDATLGTRGRSVTVGWTESWFDRLGAWHSQAFLVDAGARRPPAALASPAQQAEGLEVGQGIGGRLVAAWASCDPASGICAVHAALRSLGAGGGWQPSQRLGRIDPGESPAVAVTGGGTALVGWIAGGRVICAVAGVHARRLGRGVVLAAAGRSADALTLAAGPRAGAIATWQQGSANIAIEAARFAGR